MLALWALGGSLGMSAQSVGIPTDSISILTLMEQVEKATPYTIYTNMSKPFMVKKQEGAATLELLKEALKGTFWRVSVFGNSVFVMQNLDLQTLDAKDDGRRGRGEGDRGADI